MYLASSVLFILGLKGLTSPEKARRGMNYAAFGMLLAIVGTLVQHEIVRYDWIIGGLILGSAIGIPIGLLVPMTAMPQRIAISHMFGALAATLVGVAHYYVHGSSHGNMVALDGAAGGLLSVLMGKAMNRSFGNVLFGAFGAAAVKSAKTSAGLTVHSIAAEDAAMRLAYARSVIVVPGYGMAVAQAQHVVRELAELIEKKGGEVKYAIHPVAGRMPGHMNVLLAEANVPYDKLYDMEQINPEFPRADVALVIGANDVVNPAAHDDPSSPIYGMPILDADKAQSIIVLKRSMNPGFSGIENELFYNDKTSLLFADAKSSLTKVVGEVKNL